MTKPQSLVHRIVSANPCWPLDGAPALPAETPHTTCSRHHAQGTSSGLQPPGVCPFYQLSCPHISLLIASSFLHSKHSTSLSTFSGWLGWQQVHAHEWLKTWSNLNMKSRTRSIDIWCRDIKLEKMMSSKGLKHQGEWEESHRLNTEGHMYLICNKYPTPLRCWVEYGLTSDFWI